MQVLQWQAQNCCGSKISAQTHTADEENNINQVFKCTRGDWDSEKVSSIYPNPQEVYYLERILHR